MAGTGEMEVFGPRTIWNGVAIEQEIQFLLQDINVFCHMKIKDEKNKKNEV